jgi:hypothetical protein
MPYSQIICKKFVTDFFFGLHTDAVTPLTGKIRLFVERPLRRPHMPTRPYALCVLVREKYGSWKAP